MEIPAFALIIAAAAGAAMALQGSLNAALGRIIGMLETTFVVHIVGIFVIATALYLFRLGTGSQTMLK